MSCQDNDDNKEARAKDRLGRRSLPIVKAGTSAAAAESSGAATPRYWRSVEERERGRAIALGAANEWLSDHVTHRPPVIAREAALHARDARYFDVSKSRRELGFAPRAAREVLADAVRWFTSHRV